jgi:hypothetical protein
MQIFIRLLSGKTISFDVNLETILLDIIEYANHYCEQEGTLPYKYNQIMVIQDYDNELTVSKNKILDPSIGLVSIYREKYIKEVIFLVL